MLSLLCSRTPFLGASTMDGFSKICAEITSKFSPPVKVLSLLEACFDLTSGSSLSMKTQIMGGKITENLGFKSPLRKVKIFCPFFLFIFQFSIKNCISLFLTIFEYLVLELKYQLNKDFQLVLFDF